MWEACIDQDAKWLRNLFVTLLLFYSPLNPEVLWERYRDDMSHDTWHRRITNGSITEDAYNDSLLLFTAKLTLINKSLHDFLERPLALPPAKMLCVNPQLDAELDYNKNILHGYVNQNFLRLNICQEIVVTALFKCSSPRRRRSIFPKWSGWVRKTFVYSVLLASVRQDGHVAIRVASSDIAALLLEGGQTSHSVFKILIAIDRDSMCSIPV
jgi:hypothetical protein